MRLYEAMWVCDASKGKEDATKLTDQLSEMIERAGGKVVNCAKWDERRLAYPIRDANKKKHRRGLYCLSHFNAPTDTVGKLERIAKLADFVLRVLIVQDEDGIDIAPPAADEPDNMMKPMRRGYDRDRGDRDRGDRDHDRPRYRDRQSDADVF